MVIRKVSQNYGNRECLQKRQHQRFVNMALANIFQILNLKILAIHWFVSGNTKVFYHDYHKGLAKLTVETICTNSLLFILLNYKNKSQLNIQQ